jgi:hypothetical protein
VCVRLLLPFKLTWSSSALIRARPLTALPRLMSVVRITVRSVLKRLSSWRRDTAHTQC